jgi:uroporphyrinogen-III synthase/AcrR family transcriptional regulator
VNEQVSIREKKKSEKKVRILDAAALLFSSRQYHEVMVEDVARLASIAKGTVYTYFSSKEDIYFSIMLERMGTLISTLDQKIKADTDSRNALKSYVVHLYMFMMKYQDFFLIYRKETLKAENELCSNIAEMQLQLNNMLKEIIGQGIQRNLFRVIDEGLAADLIIGTIYAAVDRGIEGNYSGKDMKFEKEEVFNFIYEGMSSQSGSLPLSNKVIVLTRTEEQNQESAAIFKDAGAEVISFPVLKVVPLETENINYYLSPSPDYIVFTSINAIKIFADKIDINRIDKNNTRIIAVGPATAAVCKDLGFIPDIIPQKHSAEGLAEYFNGIEVEGHSFLIPRSAAGREEFIDYLNSRNAKPLPVNIYDIVLPAGNEIEERRNTLFNSAVDIVTFASPSAFRNFLSLTGDEGRDLLKKSKIAAIGSTTAGEITSQEFKVDIQPDVFTMEGLKNAVIEYYKKENN